MKLPSLLSGPIIRRVEPEQVYIWIATSFKQQMSATFYRVSEQDNQLIYKNISTSTETKTIQAGDHLYVSLIKITPGAGPFPTDTLIGYNLYFSNKKGIADLISFNLLSAQNPQSIVYGDLKYPSFYIPKNKQSTFLYGSCRKPHGKGEDVLAGADESIWEHHLNLEKRPSNLFLMGDQIYADDVADPLFPMLASLGKQIIGDHEQLDKIDERLKLPSFQASIDKTHSRQYIMETFCKFTSGNAANHLIRFREFAAMYLMTYGPQLWESASDQNPLPPFKQLLNHDELYFMYPNKTKYKNERAKELEQHHKRYTEQSIDVLQFIETLVKVRRVLANTPTYMIFDDHDLTDDWNITHDWQKSVRDAPLGRHTIANGLAAYWLFQGWGNDPEAFDHAFFYTMAQYFETFQTETTYYEKWLDQLWNFDRWHFVAPTKPTTLFLDTRTMREFDIVPHPIRVGNTIDEDTNAPQLISKDGWGKINKTLSGSEWVAGDRLIVISPTPLYGIGVIESFLHDYVYPLRILGIPIRYQLDFEVWKYNGKGFNRFLQQISEWNPEQCFILSGDVHYAGAVKSDVEFNDKQKITIHQFTSSPISNMSFSGIWGMLMRGSVWVNAQKRKRRVIYRSCDEKDNLIIEKSAAPCSNGQKWKESIRYLNPLDGSFIETHNNIGMLTVDEEVVENKLLRFEGERKLEVMYEPILLKKGDQ